MNPEDRVKCIDALLEYHYMKYMYDAVKMHKFFAYGFKGMASLTDDELISELKKHRYQHSSVDDALREVVDNMIVG